ncbi:stage 0 sporulation family protein [Planctomycetota bacterium]
MAKTKTAKSIQARNRKYMLVRYGRMNQMGLFEHRLPSIPKVPTRVVVKTDKGLQIGSIIGPITQYKSGQLKLDRSEINEYFSNSQIDLSLRPVGKFIRYASPDDLSEKRHLRQIAKEEMKNCNRLVKEMDLDMKIVDADHILGGERIIFYFMADGRVDFRALVKKLAQEYQTRIEMRQVGSRDEAKLLGDVETCGQPCCCARFLKALKPVNMRMAKMQKATLDPSKISGYCGRLKCCLRYEDETYTELKKFLPNKKAMVKTSQGQGIVIDKQILTQLVMVQLEDGKRVAFPVEELEILETPKIKKKKQEDTQNDPKQKKDSDKQEQDQPDKKQS